MKKEFKDNKGVVIIRKSNAMTNHILSTVKGVRVRVMVFNVTYDNISAISWWSVLLVEETKLPKAHKPKHSRRCYNIVVTFRQITI
jgi:hypothetical protein